VDKQLTGEIVKIDEEQGRVYGWAYTFTKNGQQVVDHSQDVIDTPEARSSLEEAFVEYVKDHRTGDLDHEQFDVSQLIEAVFIDKAKAELMGASFHQEGLWVGYEFNRDTAEGLKAWNAAKTRGSFSIVGSGRRETIG
jgi:hypothetical protein